MKLLKSHYDRIENAILSHLKERLPQRVTRIDSFPDNPGDYDFPQSEQAVVFARYAGSDYLPSGDTLRDVYAPHRVIKIQIVFLVRSLRQSERGIIGAYELMDEIRRALHGHSFCGSTPMVPKRDFLDGEHEGVWRWVMEFTLTVPVIAETQKGR